MVSLMAVRWPRLRQAHASWALLFCLSLLSVTPGGEELKVLGGVIIEYYVLAYK